MKWTSSIVGGPPTTTHNVVRVDNKIYLIGGFYTQPGGLFKCLIFCLNIDTHKWIQVGCAKLEEAAPESMEHHSMVAYGKKIYIWGGVYGNEASNALHCFDTKKLEWSEPAVTGELPPPTFAHCACVVENRMYIFFGSQTDDIVYDEVYYLDLDLMVWHYVPLKGQPPMARQYSSCLAYGGGVFFFGGLGDYDDEENGPYMACSPYIHFFDTATGTWINLMPSGDWPVPRRNVSMWLHNEYIYIFGGFDDVSMTHLNDMHKYSIKDNHWGPVTPIGKSPPLNVTHHAVAMCGNKLYLFGGSSYQEHKIGLHINFSYNVYVYDYLPSLMTLSICSLFENKQDTRKLHLSDRVRMEISSMRMRNKLNIAP